MVILHIARIGTNPANGVHVAVPLHIQAQAQFAQVGLVNLSNIDVLGDLQFEYKGGKDFPDYLPAPFNKPDIVVFQEVNCIEYIKLYKRLLKKNVPYIIVPHGEITCTALRKKWLKKKIAYTLWFNRFIKKAAAVQCLSSNEASDSVIAKNKFVVPNGMDLHKQKPVHLEREGMKLLYIGRLEFKIKGLDLMVDAVTSIADYMRTNKITIDIYGPDYANHRENLISYIEFRNVADIIKVNKPIFGKDKEKAIMDGDVFIQTSRSEGMPMGILEVLSYGMPAIVTTGTRLENDINNHKCGYAAGGNANTIAEAIVKASQTKSEWAAMGQNGRRLISSSYSWEEIAKNSIETMQRIVGDTDAETV